MPNDIDAFVHLLKQRTLDNDLRDMGFEHCADCDCWTDHKDSNDEPCCESCCEAGDAETVSEQRYANGGRI